MSEIALNNTNHQPRLRAALDKVRPEMLALGLDDLLQVTIDPLTAVGFRARRLPADHETS